MSDLSVLFMTHPYPNYVPDLLLHGLRKLLGPALVDYPRKESLYRGELMGVTPDNQLCPNWFPPDDGMIDRDDMPAKISRGYFRYIICDARAAGFLQRGDTQLPPGMVVVDGEDFPMKIPPGPYAICRRETDGSDFSIPLPMALPEEILRWIQSYDSMPKAYSVGFLGSFSEFCEERKDIAHEIARRYPDSLLRTTTVPSGEDPNPEGRFGRNDYYMNLQKCRVVLNLRGAGADTFRFWENAACNAVHLSQRMSLYIPDDFVEGRHILRFSTSDELYRAVDAVLENTMDTDRMIREGREHLAKFHTTTARARYLLDRLENVF